jgi:AcrR family transcriptional regulator
MARPPNPEAPQRLLEAARATFAEVGFDAARIQDIAARAGFSKAAFYLYYDSKDTVFARLCEQFFLDMDGMGARRHAAFTALVQRLGACCAEDYAESSARLSAFDELDHAFNLEALRVMWDNRDTVACILDQTVGPRREMVDRFVELTRATLSTRLREASALGFLRPDIDGDLASEMIVGVYMQLARRMLRLTETPDLELWARQIDRFISQGIGPRPPAALPENK